MTYRITIDCSFQIPIIILKKIKFVLKIMHASIRLFLSLVIIGYSSGHLKGQVGLKCLQNLTISTSYGETISTQCSSSNGTDSEVIRFRTNTSATLIGFLIVNDQNVIIHQTTQPFISFTGFAEASLRVYAFSFLGQLNSNVGSSLDTAILANRCYELSKNYIQVSNTPLNGGTLFSEEGIDQKTFCHGDGQSDLLTVNYQSEGNTSAIFVINQNHQVVYIGGDTLLDFESLPAGTYTIRGISYTGSLLISEGAIIPTDQQLATGCFSLSPESITVENILPNGGRIRSSNGELPITICRYPDSVTEELIALYVNGQSNQPYGYILVNDEGIIEAISIDGQFDLKNLPPTTKKVYGISFPATFPFSIGQKWEGAITGDGCTGVSTNHIEIRIPVLSTGTVYIPTNADTLFYCAPEDGESLVLMNDFEPSAGTVKYLITDQNDRPILSLLGNQINTHLFPEGEFHIWAVQYSGVLTVDYGQPVTEQSLSSECAVLSDYPMVFFKYNTQSFDIAMSNGSLFTYLCPNEGLPDIVSFGPSDSGPNLLQYAVLNAEGIILDQTNNQVYNFSNYSPGNYRLIGVSYLGKLLEVKGQHIDTALFSTACFTLSTNQLSVEIGTLEAGDIELVAPLDGKIHSCNPWLEAKFYHDSFPSEFAKAWIVVDENQQIAGVEFHEQIDWSPYPAGSYQLYGLVYSGELSATIGANFATQNFSNDCFSLSNSPITIEFSRPEGGALPSETWLTCSSNPEDFLVLPSEVAPVSSFSKIWVILEVDNQQVVEITESDTLWSADYPEGDYLIKRLSYWQLPEELALGVTWNEINMDSTDCYDWSAGELVWANKEPIAPELSFSDRPDGLVDSICVLKNSRYVITLNQNFDPNYFHRVVITNDSFVVLDEDAGLQPDFSSYDSQHLLIHSIAALDSIGMAKGDTLSQIITQTSHCIGINQVLEVMKTEVGGGRLTTNWSIDSDTLYTCLQDGIPDWITIIPTEHSTNSSYTFLITNAEDEILGKLSNPTRNYDNNIFGELKIYGISHEGTLDFSIGTPISSVKVAGDCYDWAEQYITIISDQVDGGTIASSFGAEYFDYCGDGSQQLELETTSTSSVGYAFLLWGADSTIQRISWSSTMPLDGLPQGEYEISGVSFTGIWNLKVGDSMAMIPTEGCYEWASNTLKFNLLGAVDAGMIYAVGFESDTVYTCPGNGSADVVELAYTSNLMEGSYAFMLTDERDTILYPSIPISGLLNFENAPEGLYKAYGISYTGQLNGQANRNIRTLELSNECYAFTPNPLIIVNQYPSAGQIYVIGKEGETHLIPNCDSIITSESWSFEFEEKIGFSAFIVTDASGFIINALESGVPFEIPDEYACQTLIITGMAYSGVLENLEGQNINELEIEQCYALSTNQITLSPSDDAQHFPYGPLVNHANFESPNTLKNCLNPNLIAAKQPLQTPQSIHTTYSQQSTNQPFYSTKIYPNPIAVEQLLQIEFFSDSPFSKGENHLHLYDNMGRKLLEKRVASSLKRVELNLGKLRKGIYLIYIWNNNKKVQTHRLLVN